MCKKVVSDKYLTIQRDSLRRRRSVGLVTGQDNLLWLRSPQTCDTRFVLTGSPVALSRAVMMSKIVNISIAIVSSEETSTNTVQGIVRYAGAFAGK